MDLFIEPRRQGRLCAARVRAGRSKSRRSHVGARASDALANAPAAWRDEAYSTVNTSREPSSTAVARGGAVLPGGARGGLRSCRWRSSRCLSRVCTTRMNRGDARLMRRRFKQGA